MHNSFEVVFRSFKENHYLSQLVKSSQFIIVFEEL